MSYIGLIFFINHVFSQTLEFIGTVFYLVIVYKICKSASTVFHFSRTKIPIEEMALVLRILDVF
jgi:hypothetical protein